jgi:hypothetical protein
VAFGREQLKNRLKLSDQLLRDAWTAGGAMWISSRNRTVRPARYRKRGLVGALL